MNLVEMLAVFVKESVGENKLPDRAEEKSGEKHMETMTDWEQEADLDAVLGFCR